MKRNGIARGAPKTLEKRNTKKGEQERSTHDEEKGKTGPDMGKKKGNRVRRQIKKGGLGTGKMNVPLVRKKR